MKSHNNFNEIILNKKLPRLDSLELDFHAGFVKTMLKFR